ncbi:MAG TPA: hypothetical protein VFQ23_11690, partial [Anaerolineales bacterium]|nr:hypothetical protein [Anaerolineales bacterium]
MLSKVVKISIVLLSLLALVAPVPAKSAAADTPPAEAVASTELSTASLPIGESTSVIVKLNNIPMDGYKSAEFTCTYDGALVE